MGPFWEIKQTIIQWWMLWILWFKYEMIGICYFGCLLSSECVELSFGIDLIRILLTCSFQHWKLTKTSCCQTLKLVIYVMPNWANLHRSREVFITINIVCFVSCAKLYNYLIKILSYSLIQPIYYIIFCIILHNISLYTLNAVW